MTALCTDLLPRHEVHPTHMTFSINPLSDFPSDTILGFNLGRNGEPIPFFIRCLGCTKLGLLIFLGEIWCLDGKPRTSLAASMTTSFTGLFCAEFGLTAVAHSVNPHPDRFLNPTHNVRSRRVRPSIGFEDQAVLFK